LRNYFIPPFIPPIVFAAC